MDQYFDIKLVRKLQEEVTCESESKGPIDTGDGFGKLCKECYKPIKDCICRKDIPEGKQVECESCGKMVDSSKCTPNQAQEQGGVICNCCSGKNESIAITESKSEWFAKEKLAKLKIRLTRVRQLYKKNPKESEKYEREGVALEGEIEELEGKIKDFADKKSKKEAPKESKLDDTQVKEPAPSKDTDNVALAKEVKEDVETMPETEPITKPDTQPDKKPMPRVPNWPQPNVNPKPKAQRTPSQEAFIKARESRIVKVK